MAVTVSSRSFITYLPDSLYVCLPAISLDDYLSMFQRSSAPTVSLFPRAHLEEKQDILLWSVKPPCLTHYLDTYLWIVDLYSPASFVNKPVVA